MTRAIGAQALAVRSSSIPAGESLCPYHYEYEEEWLVVLDGSVLVRTPDGEESLQAGEIVHFPAGQPAHTRSATAAMRPRGS